MTRKSYLVILGYFLILIAIPAFFYLFQTQLKSFTFKPKVQPKLIRETTVPQIAAETHPSLFYAELEYDPKTNLVTQHNLGKTNGDSPSLLLSPPPANSADFIYKVDIVSDKDVLLRSGWVDVPKEVAQTPQKTLSFRVTTLYEDQAIVRVSLPEKGIIWTGRME